MSLDDYGYAQTQDESPAPGVPQTGHKAWTAAAGVALSTFITGYVADVPPFTANEALTLAGAAISASGLVGLATYYIKNRLR